MEYKELPTVILTLVFIGMLVGVGAIVFTSTGDADRDQITVSNENHTANLATLITTLDNTQVKEITSVKNATNTLTATTDYNATITATTTTVKISSAYNNTQLNYNYVYYSDTTATTQFDNLTTALAAISTTWLGLIVTIIVLAIILKMVIGSFGGGMR